MLDSARRRFYLSAGIPEQAAATLPTSTIYELYPEVEKTLQVSLEGHVLENPHLLTEDMLELVMLLRLHLLCAPTRHVGLNANISEGDSELLDLLWAADAGAPISQVKRYADGLVEEGRVSTMLAEWSATNVNGLRFVLLEPADEVLNRWVWKRGITFTKSAHKDFAWVKPRASHILMGMLICLNPAWEKHFNSYSPKQQQTYQIAKERTTAFVEALRKKQLLADHS